MRRNVRKLIRDAERNVAYLDVVHAEYVITVIHVLFEILFLEMTFRREKEMTKVKKSLSYLSFFHSRNTKTARV